MVPPESGPSCCCASFIAGSASDALPVPACIQRLTQKTRKASPARHIASTIMAGFGATRWRASGLDILFVAVGLDAVAAFETRSRRAGAQGPFDAGIAQRALGGVALDL
jgi:hypothetical protein